jgi:hypothetical protein
VEEELVKVDFPSLLDDNVIVIVAEVVDDEPCALPRDGRPDCVLPLENEPPQKLPRRYLRASCRKK